MADVKRWAGPLPTKCDICGSSLVGKGWVDGRTRMGPWGNLCIWCHTVDGCGLGLGKGQKYDENGIKVAG